MNKYFKLVICIFILALFRFSCSDDDKDPIKFSVKSTDGNFTGGWYKANGGSTGTFTGLSIGSNIYEYELTLDDLDYLEVGACKISVNQSIEIKIYKDGTKVKSDKLEPNQQSGGIDLYCLELDYSYDE